MAGVLSRQADWVYRGPGAAAMSIRALREIQTVLNRSADAAQRATIKFRLANFLAYGTGELEEAEGMCAQAVELYRSTGDRPRMLLAANELASLRGEGQRRDVGLQEGEPRPVRRALIPTSAWPWPAVLAAS